MITYLAHLKWLADETTDPDERRALEGAIRDEEHEALCEARQLSQRIAGERFMCERYSMPGGRR